MIANPTHDKHFEQTLVEICLNTPANVYLGFDEVHERLRTTGFTIEYLGIHSRAIAEAIYKRDLLIMDGRIV